MLLIGRPRASLVPALVALLGASCTDARPADDDTASRSAAQQTVVARRRVSVELPRDAAGQVGLRDERSGLAIAFVLEEARPVQPRPFGSTLHYERALGGDADLIHRVTADGFEDTVVFKRPPSYSELHYVVDVRGV